MDRASAPPTARTALRFRVARPARGGTWNLRQALPRRARLQRHPRDYMEFAAANSRQVLFGNLGSCLLALGERGVNRAAQILDWLRADEHLVPDHESWRRSRTRHPSSILVRLNQRFHLSRLDALPPAREIDTGDPGERIEDDAGRGQRLPFRLVGEESIMHFPELPLSGGAHCRLRGRQCEGVLREWKVHIGQAHLAGSHEFVAQLLIRFVVPLLAERTLKVAHFYHPDGRRRTALNASEVSLNGVRIPWRGGCRRNCRGIAARSGAALAALLRSVGGSAGEHKREDAERGDAVDL